MSFNKEEELKIQKIRDWILTQEHLPQEFGENFLIIFFLSYLVCGLIWFDISHLDSWGWDIEFFRINIIIKINKSLVLLEKK